MSGLAGKRMFGIGAVILTVAATIAIAGCAGDGRCLQPVNGRDAVLTGWGINPGELAAARKAGFKQIIDFTDDPARLAALVKEAGEQKIGLMGCVRLGLATPYQEMSAEENAFLKRMLADKSRDKGGYQWGGEPQLPLEVLNEPLGCIHHAEVRENIRVRIKAVLSVDGIKGVALDFCGYQNYRCCRCPLSMQMAKAFHKLHPAMTEEEALETFSRNTLIDFYNEMANYAHSLKPDAVVACHIYPSFLPDIFYGNRTRLDECSQTVAWYYKPYWPEKRIAEHVRNVCGDASQQSLFNGPAAFIGVPTDLSSDPQKPVEQVEFELRAALRAGARRIHVCSTSNIIKSPAYAELFRRIFASPE